MKTSAFQLFTLRFLQCTLTSSESLSVNGDLNSNARNEELEQQVDTTKANKLRESLRDKGWTEIEAHNIKDSIYRFYGCNGEVWNYKSKKSGK